MPDGAAIPEPTLAALPADVALLQAMVRDLLATVHAQQRRIAQLEHQVDQLAKRLYGPRADRLHPDNNTAERAVKPFAIGRKNLALALALLRLRPRRPDAGRARQFHRHQPAVRRGPLAMAA